MTDKNNQTQLPIPTEYHGNIAPNIHNLESTELKRHLVDKNRESQQHYKEAGVTLSDFKPTQNVWKGNEKDLDPVLTSGDLGKDVFFTSAFERQNKGLWLGESGDGEDRTLHGNKGKNLGNLESSELNDTLKNKHQEMAAHFKEANVRLSDFKPTQNVQIGHEKDLDSVLVKGDLGKDVFFTNAFARQEKGSMFSSEGGEMLHGNKGLNISNLESRELKDTLLHKHEEMADNYKNANVTLSDFKPTQNIQKGHEKDLDPVLIAGDLGKDKFFTDAFERQLKGGKWEEVGDNTLHGNKGANLGNLESEEMRKHVIDNNKKMAENYSQAHVTLSDFKPTQNIEKGKENQLDSVLISGDLGKDQFFTKAFENQAKIDESQFQGHGHGNKGINTSNLASVDYIDNMIHNIQKSDQNVKDAHIRADSFKPTLDKFIGRNMAKEPSNEEAFKGQSLDEVLEDKTNETPTA
jgi:phosphoribosylaminoimidazole-succinocarboxamide synthase